MHKKIPKICTGCRVSAAKIYLDHSTKIAKARPHRVEWQTENSVQKQWFMASGTERTSYVFKNKIHSGQLFRKYFAKYFNFEGMVKIDICHAPLENIVNAIL